MRPAVVAEGLAEAQVRFPAVPIAFCETLGLAHEWTYRFLGASMAHHHNHEHGDEQTAELPEAGAVPPASPTTADVRRSARSNGVNMSDRGRLRPEIWDAYRTPHGN